MILHCLHYFLDTVGADDLGHRSDREGLIWLGKDHGAREADHLARHGISTHTPYLARHCRRNLVGSLPMGMSTVVDESVEVRVRKPDGDVELKRQQLDRFRPSDRRNTLRPMSFVDCIEYELNSMGVPTRLI